MRRLLLIHGQNGHTNTRESIVEGYGPHPLYLGSGEVKIQRVLKDYKGPRRELLVNHRLFSGRDLTQKGCILGNLVLTLLSCPRSPTRKVITSWLPKYNQTVKRSIRFAKQRLQVWVSYFRVGQTPFAQGQDLSPVGKFTPGTNG